MRMFEDVEIDNFFTTHGLKARISHVSAVPKVRKTGSH